MNDKRRKVFNMNDSDFYNIMWSEITRHGKAVLPNHECVCTQIKDIFLVCTYHQRMLKEQTSKVTEGSS